MQTALQPNVKVLLTYFDPIKNAPKRPFRQLSSLVESWLTFLATMYFPWSYLIPSDEPIGMGAVDLPALVPDLVPE